MANNWVVFYAFIKSVQFINDLVEFIDDPGPVIRIQVLKRNNAIAKKPVETYRCYRS